MMLGADPVAGTTGRTMTGTEVAGFLASHPLTAARVAYHKTSTSIQCLPVGEGTLIPGAYEWERENLGVPWRGLAVDDARLGGVVVIFPDARCDLRYSLTSGIPSGVLNAPEPESEPFDRGILSDIRDFSNLLLPVVALWGLLFAWKTIR